MTIGELAGRAGVKPSTIRYYESLGLLPEPERESGQRRYGEETLRLLDLIDVAKRAGFSLEETGVLLATREDGAPLHPRLRELAQRKLPEVEALIGSAEAMRSWLLRASDCSCPTLDICALFDAPPTGGPGNGQPLRRLDGRPPRAA